MALIKRNKENLVTFRTLTETQKLIIYPGVNDINEETPILLATPGKNEGPKEGKLKEHPLYIELLKNGVHQYVQKKIKVEAKASTEDKSSSTSDVTKMNADDAVEVIGGILSIAQLEKIKNDEMQKGKNRKRVIDAINDQIADIKTVPSTEDKKDEKDKK